MLSNLPDEFEKLDPRVKRTRQLIDQAFVELLQEKGFEAVSVQDITGRAGVNRATFYAHFEDKFALLDYSIREAFHSEIKKRLLEACHYSLENVRQLIITVCEFTRNLTSHCVPSHRQFEPLVENQIKAQLYGLLFNWLKKNGQTASPETSATAASWAIYGLAMQWNREKKNLSAEEFADQVLPLVAANLGAAQAV